MISQPFATAACRTAAVLFLLLAPTLTLANGRGTSATRPKSGPAIEVAGGFLVPYDEKIPGTEIVFRMMPIPGGVVTLGSPAEEPDRNADEGPRAKVCIPPMWVARCEVTWAQYHAYMGMYGSFKQFDQLRHQLAQDETKAEILRARLAKNQAIANYLDVPANVDAVTCPTPLYDTSFTYEPGKSPQQPAVTMTQFAARQFTKWLSGITGREYRLPSEAEWEYFARAGTTTAYSFGEDSSSLDNFAWHAGNSKDQTHPVGTKQENPWGLHDVHGNVAEWVLDQYDIQGYTTTGSKTTTALNAIHWPTQLEPRVLRGGSWLDNPPQLRCAARQPSTDDDWSMSDPNLPKSPWWFTEYEATGVGLRIVRRLQPMDADTKRRVWEADVKNVRLDVEDRLAEGRGTIGPTRPELPAAVDQLNAIADDL